MGLGRLPQLLIQTVNGLVSARPRVLQVDTANMTLVESPPGTLTLGATGGGGGNVATDAIWDAKGDLAVGTGADTAAKLTVGTNGQALVADSTQTTGVKWADAPGTGTVTSVAATVPTGFSVSGSPVTAAGTLAVTLDTQTANKVLASATSGGSATPDFRALVAGDIPAIAESGVTSLVTDLGLKAPVSSPTFTGITTAPEFSASGLTGATAASRYVGATASGAPASGTFAVGDWISDQTGKRWTCTVAGTPGTWAQEPGTGGGSTPVSARYLRSAGNYTTTSASFVDVDSTNLKFTLTTGAHSVMIGFVGSVTNTTAEEVTAFDIAIDSTRVGDTTWGLVYCQNENNTNDIAHATSFVFLSAALSAASHTFELQWKVSGGTSTLLGGSGNPQAHFWVMEQGV